MTRCTALLLAASLACAQPAPAASPIAQVICAPAAQMTARLAGRHGHSRTAMGLRSPDEMLEVWTGADGGWTLVVAYATGQSCIVAMGQDWTPLAPRDPA